MYTYALRPPTKAIRLSRVLDIAILILLFQCLSGGVWLTSAFQPYAKGSVW